MRTRVVAALAVAMVVAGCTAPQTPAAGPTSSPSSSPSSSPPGHHTKDCGTLTLRQGQQLPPEPARCVIEATKARGPARLVVTFPTVEGDPIITSYAVTADGQVEVTTDARADRFGSAPVERRTCTGPATDGGVLLTFDTCSSPVPG